MAAHGGGSMMCSVDASTLSALISEVDAPALQRTVLRLAGAAAQADRHLADAEALVMAAAREQWGLAEEGAAAMPGRPLAQAA
jgi:hypothetical protein